MQIGEFLRMQLNSSTLTNKAAIKPRFDEVAKYLLSHCFISVDEREYYLAEIEFYFHSENHPDPYVHKHPNQLETGLWYFHNVGQDLTFGSSGSYGGILIRGLRSHDGEKYIDGPIRTFDELFNLKLLLNDKHCLSILLTSEPFLSKTHKIYSFPRVGMYPAGREHDEEYFLNRYRYMSYPWLSKSERHVIYLYLKYFENDHSMLDKLQVDKSMIREYEKAYTLGKTTNKEELADMMSGRVKMNVNNKCQLLGLYTNSRK